jgi:hypothetical protein
MTEIALWKPIEDVAVDFQDLNLQYVDPNSLFANALGQISLE